MEHVITNAQTGEVTVVPFTPEEVAACEAQALQDAWADLRAERNKRLAESDLYVLPDRWASYSPAKQLEWSSYRQALRDLPANTTDPFNPVWPVKPA